jgi:hypothetical protein
MDAEMNSDMAGSSEYLEDALDQARSEIPREWIFGEEALMGSLFEKLVSRCKTSAGECRISSRICCAQTSIRFLN